MKRLGIVVLVVLIDLLGFSLVIPLLPRYAESYGFGEIRIGLLLGAFPLCQLVAGPVLGRLSDRYGRRPLLVASQLGTTVSFLMLGLSSRFEWLLLARMLDGASGGNILVAQAYIADVTRPEDRAKGMGLLGAAFGVGFTLGPILGGVLVGLPVDPAWRLRLPFLVAAGCSTLAWLLVLRGLPESLPADARGRHRPVGPSRRGLAEVLGNRTIGMLVGLGALMVLAFSALEATFSLYLERRMGWEAQRAAYYFALFGVVGLVVQGGLIRTLVPRFGERRLIVAGLIGMLGGFVGLARAADPAALVGSILLVATGYSLVGPSVSGLLSRSTPPTEQGAVFGTYSSAQTLMRCINYLAAPWLLGAYGSAVPYWEGAAIIGVALGVAIAVVRGRGRGSRSSADRPADPPGPPPGEVEGTVAAAGRPD